MKTLCLFLLSASVIFPTYAQDEADSLDEILFEEAAEHFEDGDYLTAAIKFEQFRKQYPQSELVARAHFNMALSYHMFKDYETSKKLFLEILDERYNERDPNSLMEPYTLYKHHTCRYLADMALEQKDYNEAEKYIRLFDKKYPYQHFCGNEWSAYDMYKAVMYAKVYEGTNQVKKAMDELLPYIFSNSLASNEDVLNELENIVEKHYSKEDAQAAFNQALASLEVKKTKKETFGTILLYGVKIEIDNYSLFGEENDKRISEQERYKQTVLNNSLFKKFL